MYGAPRVRPSCPGGHQIPDRHVGRSHEVRRSAYPLGHPRSGEPNSPSEGVRDPVVVSHCPQRPGGWRQARRLGCPFRAVSASSHKRHNLFRIWQLWWVRTHACGKAVIVRSGALAGRRRGRDPRHCAGRSIPASLNPLGRISAARACENHPAGRSTRPNSSTSKSPVALVLPSTTT